MKLYRFMGTNEFREYLNGNLIDGWTACFLKGKIPARKFEPSVKQLTDLTLLNFKSTDFNEQMAELTELILPNFEDGDFDGQLKDFEYLTLSDFMSDVREDAHAKVLVEFEATEKFEQECDKVIMAYMKYLIQEVQSNSYSMETLKCVSYKFDFENEFRNGVGVDTIPAHRFESVEQALEDLEKAEAWNTYEKTGKSQEEALKQSKEVLGIKDKETIDPELTPEEALDASDSIAEFENITREDLTRDENLKVGQEQDGENR